MSASYNPEPSPTSPDEDTLTTVAETSSDSASDSSSVKKAKTIAANWTSDPEQGNDLKKFVMNQLIKVLKPEIKGKTAVKGFVVCPAMAGHVHGDRANGNYMISAIEDFFKDIKIERFDNHHGFVAAPGMQMEFFDWEATGEEAKKKKKKDPVVRRPESYAWQNCNQKIMDHQKDFNDMVPGGWSFICFEGNWQLVQRKLVDMERDSAGVEA